MAETELRNTATSIRPAFRILAWVTLLFALGSALSCGWWKYQSDTASNELAQAAQNGAWDKYQAGLRNEFPALEWLIAAFALLVLAVWAAAVTLLYWTIARRERQRSGST
jgi:hypothetical protein